MITRFQKISAGLALLFCFFSIHLASADICGSSSSNSPTASGGTLLCDPTQSGTLGNFTNVIFNGVVAVIVIAAVAMLVYSAIRMVTSQGNEETISKAKSSFQWTVIGVAVIILGYGIVEAIIKFLGANESNNSPTAGGGTVVNPIGSSTVLDLSKNIFDGVATFIALLSVLFIIINGIRYLTARGNDEQVATAKRGLQWAIIGFLLTLLAFVIVSAVFALFGQGLGTATGRLK